MAPKKKQQTQKMGLGAFLTDGGSSTIGSWADEMEDMPIYSRVGYGASNERRTFNATTNTYGSSSNNASGYSVREELPLPSKPPFTVHLGNLSFDATVTDVTNFFEGCGCTNVRIIEDREQMKPKGFGYAEFESVEGLKKALALNQKDFQGRSIRISVADPPKQSDRPEARELGDWSRKGPLPDLPGRGGNDRRNVSDRFGSGRSGFNDAGHEGGERRREYQPDDGKVRDFGNWERKGPLSPLPQADRPPQSRDGGRPRTNDGPRADNVRDRRVSPAAWGEGRAQGSQDGSRPPRREFQERPVAERVPTAAEQDNQWRLKMRPDPPVPQSTAPSSRDGSEAPISPAINSAAPVGRPRLNLAKRTVSDAAVPEQASSSPAGEAKANPFGGARPIDTAAKEKEIEEKRLAAIKEKKEAEEAAKEEERLALEAAKEKESEAAQAGEEKTNGDAKMEILKREQAPSNAGEVKAANGVAENDLAMRPKETSAEAPKSRVETGTWRRPQGTGPPRGPANEHAANYRGSSRGGGAFRGARSHDRNDHRQDSKGSRFNGNSAPAPPSSAIPETQAPPEEEGWSTVKATKNKRGGNQATRGVS